MLNCKTQGFKMFIILCTVQYCTSTEVPAHQEDKCECVNDGKLNSTREHLKTLFHINSIQLITSLQNLALSADDEIRWIIEQARFRIFSDVFEHSPDLFHQPNFTNAVDELVYKLKKILFEGLEKDKLEVESSVEREVRIFLRSIFVPTFLSVSMGSLRTVTPEYNSCLYNASHQAYKVLFDESLQRSIVRPLAKHLFDYRSIFTTTSELRSLARSPEERLNWDCVQRYAEITNCDSCSTSGVGYCRVSCEDAFSECLGNLGSAWDGRINALQKCTEDFEYGMHSLERGVMSAVIAAAEETSPEAASIVFELCGPIRETKPQRSADNNRVIESPKTVSKRTLHLINHLVSKKGWWSRLGSKTCGQPSEEPLCWNGVRHVQSNYDLEGDVFRKYVGPQPADEAPKLKFSSSHDSFEGSSGIVDDEDLAASGSGEPLSFGDLQSDTKEHTVAKFTTTISTVASTVEHGVEHQDAIGDAVISDDIESQSTVSIKKNSSMTTTIWWSMMMPVATIASTIANILFYGN